MLRIDGSNLVDGFAGLTDPAVGQRRPRRRSALLDAACPDAPFEAKYPAPSVLAPRIGADCAASPNAGTG